MKKNKKWPGIWPEPVWDPMIESSFYDVEDTEFFEGDEEIEELLKIKEYYDELVEEGRLDEDYRLNEDYVWDDDSENEEIEADFFEPEIGSEYWNEDSFDLEYWQSDLACAINLVKIEPCETVTNISRIMGYDFINENLLRQAFTRRAFAFEYGLDGDNEQLEFFGDSVLEEVITKEIFKEFAFVDTSVTTAPFRSVFQEGDLTKLRNHYVSKEYLSKRAVELGLDKYILYGTSEEPGESANANMMEALIGAAAIDSKWDSNVIENIVDRLLCVQMHKADGFLKNTYYDLFNSWHQKHFGKMPEYEISGKYCCTLRYSVPENNKGISEDQRVDVKEFSRSEAREQAARKAYSFVMSNGLWINLKDAGLVPELENSINQLQELFQKKYVEQPEYEFEENSLGWYCDCFCNGMHGFGKGESKVKAKKKAAYMTIIRLLEAAGICKDEWCEGIYFD